MPRAWSWFSTEPLLVTGPLVAVLLISGLLLGGATATSAATIERDAVTFTLRDDGRLEERVERRVRLESRTDLDAWTLYGVHLDENRELTSFAVHVVDTEGKRRKIGRKAQDRMTGASDGILHTSDFFHTVELSGLEVGDRIEIAHTVLESPYFPAGLWPLLGDDPVEKLEVRVQATAPGWRFRVEGPSEGLTIEPTEEGVRIQGSDLQPLEGSYLSAGGAAQRPFLRFAWGESEDWNAVGRWYRGLLDPLAEGGETTGKLAEVLLEEGKAPADDPRKQLDVLVNFLRKKVRYVAVEVGIGGYQPSPPAEVLERLWGDCKDKSLLLIDMLQHQGLEAYPALIRLDPDQRIDAQFPAPSQFNHLIVAVPTSVVPPRAGDPVSEGYLFVDPTQTRGGVTWLHPGVQDQDALIVTHEGGELVRTPLIPGEEVRHLRFDLTLADDGSAAGQAELKLGGRTASQLIETIESEPVERIADTVLKIFKGLIPTAEATEIGWSQVEDEVPTVRLALQVEFDALASGGAKRPSVRLPSLRSTPNPRDLDDTPGPVTYPAQSSTTVWNLTLPEGWCAPEVEPAQLANPVGWLHRTVTHDSAGRVRVEHRSQLTQRWIEGDGLDDLRAIALAEYRSTRRRLRFHCSDAGGSPPIQSSNEPATGSLPRR